MVRPLIMCIRGYSGPEDGSNQTIWFRYEDELTDKDRDALKLVRNKRADDFVYGRIKHENLTEHEYYTNLAIFLGIESEDRVDEDLVEEVRRNKATWFKGSCNEHDASEVKIPEGCAIVRVISIHTNAELE